MRSATSRVSLLLALAIGCVEFRAERPDRTEPVRTGAADGAVQPKDASIPAEDAAASGEEDARTDDARASDAAPLASDATAVDAIASADAGGPVDSGPGDPDALPSGDEGIASRYAGDLGIAGDPAVVFADDFEGYVSGAELGRRWSSVFHNADVTTDAIGVHRGAQALELTSPQSNDEISNAVVKVLTNELDVVFMRFYSRFDGDFDVVGSSHNGGGVSAHYYVDGRATPGVPADGRNKFLVELESWRGEVRDPNPGRLNVYVYRPGQRSQWGDHLFPDGTILPNTAVPGDFGPEFVPRPHVVVQLERWYCYELMVKANTPGQSDGRIAFWLDGALVADFPDLRLRDVPTLKIDRFDLQLHTHANPSRTTRKWYDDLVVATEYVGPIRE